MSDRETGTVKFFNSNKGYGFIQRSNGTDIFVHLNAIRNRNEALREGDQVEFSVIKGKKGLEAEDVIVLE
ncbi:MAG: cold shock protein [Candidatus Poribacteria bacterium]|nr:cold shock protein [Candidatus Poribacteria bacterium]